MSWRNHSRHSAMTQETKLALTCIEESDIKAGACAPGELSANIPGAEADSTDMTSAWGRV